MGSFADQLKADFASICAAGEVTEAIEYQSVGEAGPEAWKAMTVPVRHGDPSAPLELGGVGKRGQDPIIVLVSRDPTAGVLEARRGDRVKLRPGTTAERIYQVQAILDTGDPAVWRLYAVA